MNIFDQKNIIDDTSDGLLALLDDPTLATEREIEKMSVDDVWGEEKKEKKEKTFGDFLAMVQEISPGSKEILALDDPEEVENVTVAPNLPKLDVPEELILPTLDVPEEVEEKKRAELLAEALRYAGIGKSVIPVGKNKRPLLDWKEFQERVATDEEIKSWWTKWPHAQLGLVTGKISGVAVVDVEKEFGDPSQLNLPPTTVSKTGSGGWHLFYKYRDGIKNHARIGGKKVDIRGEGGYVIIPPSFNENGEYRWLQKIDPLREFPEELLEETEKSKLERLERKEFVDLDFNGLESGQRNDGMARYIGAVIKKIDRYAWDKLAWPLISAANQRNKPPLSEAELKTTFDSICQKEMSSGAPDWFRAQDLLKKEKNKEAWNTILADDEVVLISDIAPELRKRRGSSISTGFAQLDDVMLGGFKEGDLTIITGISGHGKTSFGQTLTYNFSKDNISSIWFSWETTLDVLDDKFANMNGGKAGNIYVPKKLTTGEIEWVNKKIIEANKNFKVRVAFVDMIDFIIPNDLRNSDNETIVLKKATAQLKALAVELGIILFVMAHVRKLTRSQKTPEMQDIAHSGGIYQFADYVLAVTRLAETDKRQSVFQEDDNRIKTVSRIEMLKNRLTGGLVKMDCDYVKDLFIPPAPSVRKLTVDRTPWLNK